MLDLNVQYMLESFEKSYPNALNKAFEIFKSNNFHNFSIQESHFCLYGFTNEYTELSIYEAEILRTYTLWQFDKVEFEIDTSYLNNIGNSNSIERRKIIRQPFKSYYVKLNDMGVDGFFISTRYHFKIDEVNEYDNNEVFLSLIMNLSNRITHINFNIDLSSSNNLEQVIKNGWYKNSKGDPITNKMPKDVLALLIDVARLAINIVYHISDINANRPEKFSCNNKQDKITKIPIDSIREYSRKFILSSNNTTNNTTTDDENKSVHFIDNKDTKIKQSGKHPHVRSGHWHHYWIGKRGSENRKLIVKWLESTTVNCNNRKNLPNVTIQI